MPKPNGSGAPPQDLFARLRRRRRGTRFRGRGLRGRSGRRIRRGGRRGGRVTGSGRRLQRRGRTLRPLPGLRRRSRPRSRRIRRRRTRTRPRGLRVAQGLGRTARLRGRRTFRRRVARRRGFRGRERRVGTQLGQAQPAGREYEPGRDQQHPAPPPTMRGGLAIATTRAWRVRFLGVGVGVAVTPPAVLPPCGPPLVFAAGLLVRLAGVGGSVAPAVRLRTHVNPRIVGRS